MGLGHTAQFLDLLDTLPSLVGDLVGEGFDVVGTCPGIHFAADVGFLLNVDLGVTGDTCREVRRQGDRLVQCVGVQRLGVAQSGAHRLDSRTCYVVERILLGERPARGLAMRTQGQRFRVLGVEFFDDLRPEHTCRTHLGDLHEVIYTDSPEE